MSALSLRKARKLEAKIQSHADAMDLRQEVQIRVLASKEERDAAIAAARTKYNEAVQLRRSLIQARFEIRNDIATANAGSGINTLMARREAVQALLAKSTATVTALDALRAEDQVAAKKQVLDSGNSSYGAPSVTLVIPVSTEEDIAEFKDFDIFLKKELEEIEDQLSQKNLGVKIILKEETEKLLQSVGLI